jgi:hypothetical protein
MLSRKTLSQKTLSRKAVALAMVAVLALVGCSAVDGSPAVDEPDPAAEQDAGPGDADDAAGEQDDPDAGGAASSGEGASPSDEDDIGEAGDDAVTRGGAQGRIEFDDVEDTVRGTFVRVNAIESDGRAVYVEIEAFNGSASDVELVWNWPDANTVRLLVDDAPESQSLVYQPPEDNPALAIPSGGELTARLAFLGRLPADAQTISFRLNYTPIGQLTAAVSPPFTFDDLPAPGTDR